MFHLVGAHNRGRYGDLLERMFALRADAAAQRPGGGPEAAALGAGERDRFDDDEALYMLRVDSLGDIVCAFRVRPTVNSSMVAECYPDAVSSPPAPIAAPGVWEFTHYYARADRSSGYYTRLRAEVRLAIVAAAAEAGIERLIYMIEADRCSVVESSSWTYHRLGPEVEYAPGLRALAYEIETGPTDLKRLRQRLREELSNSLAEAGESRDDLNGLLGVIDNLGPNALAIVNRVSEQLAETERTEGVDAAIALAEALQRALRQDLAG